MLSGSDLRTVKDRHVSESFSNAPLIELVATVRWNEVEDSIEDSLFLNRLGRELARVGFSQSERLMPDGFDVPPSQPLYRYTRPEDTQDTVIYQAGSGAFAINAIPPYRTWEDFRPAIEVGLAAFFAALGDRRPLAQPEFIALNYVDAFDENFTGSDRIGFLRDVLKIDLALPQPFQRRFVEGVPESVFVNFSGSGSNGLETRVKAGLASVANTPRVILDMTVSRTEGLLLDAESILKVLDELHLVIHDTFIEIAQPFIGVLRSGADA